MNQKNFVFTLVQIIECLFCFHYANLSLDDDLERS